MRSFAPAGLLGLAASLLSFTAAASLPANSTINWAPCTVPYVNILNATLLCADLQVPRDYTNPGAGSITLQLTKSVALIQPAKGSILFNPGGPGLSANEEIGTGGALVAYATGLEFDVVTWDPRGVGQAMPYSCYQNDTYRIPLIYKTPSTSNSSDAARGRVWGLKKTFSIACAEAISDFGDLVGTAFTARDMMQIVDALNEDGLLHYWGFSYGSILGMTAAAMFPDRMGRVIIDGVLNPRDYYAGSDVSQLIDTDAVFAGFVKGCVASPDLCPLGRHGLDAHSLLRQMYELIERLKYDPVAYGPLAGADFIDYDLIKVVTFSLLYNPPAFFPTLGAFLDGLYTNNVTELTDILLTLVEDLSDTPPGTAPEALYGIRCGDSTLRVNTSGQLIPLIDDFYATSALGGDYLAVPQPLTCSQWPFSAKERVQTDWNVKTRNPLLFIGNKFDPVTSLASARNASCGFKGSVVLEQDGYGHTSLAQPSSCTIGHVQSYFVNGTLPARDTVCEVNVPLFTNQSFFSALSTPSNKQRRDIGSGSLIDFEDTEENILNAVAYLVQQRRTKQELAAMGLGRR